MNNELLKEAEAAYENLPFANQFLVSETDRKKTFIAGYEMAATKERERGGWQDIASAPKDGTLVDVWCDFGRVTDCMWSANHNGWGYKYGRYNDWIPVYGVTHWQPLPSPPESITTKTTPDE